MSCRVYFLLSSGVFFSRLKHSLRDYLHSPPSRSFPQTKRKSRFMIHLILALDLSRNSTKSLDRYSATSITFQISTISSSVFLRVVIYLHRGGLGSSCCNSVPVFKLLLIRQLILKTNINGEYMIMPRPNLNGHVQKTIQGEPFLYTTTSQSSQCIILDDLVVGLDRTKRGAHFGHAGVSFQGCSFTDKGRTRRQVAALHFYECSKTFLHSSVFYSNKLLQTKIQPPRVTIQKTHKSALRLPNGKPAGSN